MHTRALIIGTGSPDLAWPSRCSSAFGVEFLILEKADEIGGTWRDNTYPGCACDIPSHMYSFSFEPKADWTHMWSLQPEIFDYLKGVTDKYGLRRYVRFDSHVDRAHWDDAEMRWHVFTERRAGVRRPVPHLRRGRASHPADARHRGASTTSSAGGAAFHSAQWDHACDLTGKRVAVIGTGASAIQLVPGDRRGRRRTAGLPAHSAVGDATAQQRPARMDSADLHRRARAHAR